MAFNRELPANKLVLFPRNNRLCKIIAKNVRKRAKDLGKSLVDVHKDICKRHGISNFGSDFINKLEDAENNVSAGSLAVISLSMYAIELKCNEMDLLNDDILYE